MEKKYYWTTKSGKKVDVDEMDVEHLRNVLKHILRKRDERKNDFLEPYSEDWMWK